MVVAVQTVRRAGAAAAAAWVQGATKAIQATKATEAIQAIKAGQAGPVARQNRSQLGFKLIHRAIDQRLFLLDCGAIQQQSLGKKRRARGDYVSFSYEDIDVARVDILRKRNDLDQWVESSQANGGLINSRLPHTCVAHEKLAIEVIGSQVAGVGQNDPAHARCCKLQRQRAADAADARDQHRRVLEAKLPGLAEACDR